MRKPNQEPLTPERIIDAAAALAAEDGALNLSMRRLGRRLGVDVMAIYYYFSSKDELSEALRARMIAEVPNPDDTLMAWDERIRVVMLGFRRASLQYAHLHPVFVLQRNTSPYVAERIRHEQDVLRLAGFDEVNAAAVFRALASYVNGFVLGETHDRTPAVPERCPDEPAETIGPLPSRGEQNDLAFERGLDAMIDGFRQLHTAIALRVNGSMPAGEPVSA